MLTMRNDQFPDGKNSASRPAVSNPPIGPAARPTRPERAPLTLEGAPDNRRRYGPGPVTFHPATGTLCPLRAKPADGRGHQKCRLWRSYISKLDVLKLFPYESQCDRTS